MQPNLALRLEFLEPAELKGNYNLSSLRDLDVFFLLRQFGMLD